jgi:signal transduction histidine kinase
MSLREANLSTRFEIDFGEGEMAERIRAFDWSKTPLGPVSAWSPALRTALRIMLANRFPHVLWWGPKYIQFYNDPYIPIPGTKHPDVAFGRPASECWAEIWHVIGPLIDRPFGGGPATWDDDIALEVRRHGYLEESHFVIAYSPVPDETEESGIGGVLATVHEITEKIVAERRVRTLRDLGARLSEAKTAEEACAVAAETFAEDAKDVPFALIYLIDHGGASARLAGTAGISGAEGVAPVEIDLAGSRESVWPLAEAAQSETMGIVERLGEKFAAVPAGPWSDPPHTAAVVPIPSHKAGEPAGVMVLGVSARLKFDDVYGHFFDLVKTQLSNAIANARAYEEEKKRAEALAEIDRAKTAFFSNVSHEFRTPLTLMLGPVEDMLQSGVREISQAAKGQLEVVHRNGLRLLRLVNTLLDFSRIEAGRVRASYQATDLAAFTCDLGSVFRAAIERAGMRLVIDCPPLSDPVYVDRDMWEKIVLNLLSNAFKYTLEGEIHVVLRETAGAVELRVRDTGTGISADEMPRLFERFHRVQNARGRTHEGSGIGLALVQELVRLHGGVISAASVMGEGTSFTISVPKGTSHLPAEQIVATRERTTVSNGASPFVEEALRWLPDENGDGERNLAEILPSAEALPVPAVPRSHGEADSRPRVLIADDNADMRRYVVRLLAERYRVEAFADGEAALETARRMPPDLILTDVMMPRLDGFGLLGEVRSDASLRDTPVIMLSARAGEESRVEGVEAGADDYLVKPFSARELIARVDGHLKMARLRRERERLLESEQRARQDAERANRLKDEFLATLSHELRTPLNAILGWSQILERRRDDALTVERGIAAISRSVLAQTQLIEDLLDTSRIISGKLRLERKPVDVADVVAAAVESVMPAANARQILVVKSLDRFAGRVLGDPARLQQVVWNLLTNAVKFTPNGGKVTVTLERRSSQVEITVRDTGVGIAPEFLPMVFERFRQADSSSSRRYGGLGIGLTLVEQLVEMHAGSVRVHSDGEGRGATFTVTLPLYEPEFGEEQWPRDTEGAPTTRPADDAALEGIRVLYVDDDPDARELSEKILADRDADVTLATSADEALTVLRTQRPHVLMSDIGLPEVDGYELIRRVRALPADEGGRIPAAALTAFARPEDRRKALRAGYQSHIAKPVMPEELVALVARLAGRAPER